jgi:hypothetical protein
MDDFDDDFVDASDADSSSDADPSDHSCSSTARDHSSLSDDDAPQVIEAAVSDVFAAADKLSTLTLSLTKSREFANSETNQLYSLFFCVFQDCELLLAKNRSAIPFSIHTEIFRLPNVKYENGVITHKQFPDGVNLSRIDCTALPAFLGMRWDIASRALPPAVQAACNRLKEPLVRAHNTLRTIKQKMSDLRKSNAGLTLQTRQVANRLVRISKTGKDVDGDGAADKSDVIIHQQKLQKALTRVYNLREANEAAVAANTELQARVGVEGARPVAVGTKPNARTEELQRSIAELSAGLEQSEEERETAMAQRRVSLTRMNTAIQKAAEELERLRSRIGDVDNRLRIMTQGQKVSEGPKQGGLAKKGSGSRIAIHYAERAPDQ